MRYPIPAILTCCLLACSPPGDGLTGPLSRIESDTVPLDNLRLWEWPRDLSPQWEIVSVSPLSTRHVPDSRYTGFLSVVPGRLEASYVHWYYWTPGDTLHIDFRVRVRCRRTTIPELHELRILFAMTPELPTPIDVTARTPAETRQYLVARGYRDVIRDPEAEDPSKGPLIRLEDGPWISIPALTPCEIDSVYVRLSIADLLNDGFTPPRPFWVWVELWNRSGTETVVGKMAVGIDVRERFE